MVASSAANAPCSGSYCSVQGAVAFCQQAVSLPAAIDIMAIKQGWLVLLLLQAIT
jgi:hypothetical protein